MLIEVTGIDKSKVSAAKPEVLTSQLLTKIATKFLRLYPCPGFVNTAELVGTLSDIGVTGKSKMAASAGSDYEITQYLSF